MNVALAFGYIVVIALFGAAGSQFISAHLRAQAHARQRGAGQTPAQHWRKFRFAHERAKAQTPAPGYAQRIFWGYVFLCAALAILAVLLWASP
jgi:hypothetical protein